MAMTLNLTLVVQMAHFMVAYFIISKFLLKPGYEAVKSDAEKLHQLSSLIIGEQEKLAEKKEYKRKRWQLCQNYFYQNRPDLEVEQKGLKSLGMVQQVPAMTKAELENRVAEIGEKLKKKVLHD